MYIVNQTDYSAGPKKCWQTCFHYYKYLKKMYMLEIMSTAVSSYRHSVIFKGCRYFVFFMGWFNFISLFLWIRVFAVIWLMVHFYEGDECCLLNGKWKSLSLNQALRKTTSVSAGICSFVMPFYYAGSFGRITISRFWSLEDVFKGNLCELVQLYFVRGI